MMYLQVAGGLVFLFAGGEFLVRGSVSLARGLGVSALVIGLTLVGFGTSAPELVVSLDAVLKGYPDIAVGNVVGSNIANILLILGVSATIFPIACSRRAIKRDGYTLLAITMLFALAALWGTFYRWEGALMLLALAVYLVYSYRDERVSGPLDPAAELRIREAQEFQDLPGGVPTALAVALGGIALLIMGAHWLVEGGVQLARAVGVSEAVIGLTLVAIGTSLPELATSIVAALRRHSDVALGNVLGSNMFNLLGVMGAAALAGPVAVARKLGYADVWIMFLVTGLLLLFMIRGSRLSRLDALVFLVAYAAYVTLQFNGLLGLSAVSAPVP